MQENLWGKISRTGKGPAVQQSVRFGKVSAWERDWAFRKCWLHVGQAGDVPEAGDYLLRDIAILTCFGSDDSGYGRKRSRFSQCLLTPQNKLVSGERRTCGEVLPCRFHGWTYKDRNALIHVPDEENFFDFDKWDHGLARMHTDIWAGGLRS